MMAHKGNFAMWRMTGIWCNICDIFRGFTLRREGESLLFFAFIGEILKKCIKYIDNANFTVYNKRVK